MVLSSTFVTCLLGMAAGVLALSILVQVLQELYKYLRNSKTVLYREVLVDLLGPSVGRLWSAPEFADLRVRGALQFQRRRPTGRLLPLEKNELSSALTRMAPPWVQRVLAEIRRERQFPREGAPLSSWRTLLDQLGAVHQGSPGYWVARQIAECLQDNGHTFSPLEHQVGRLEPTGAVDFARLESAFRDRFLPQVTRAEQMFPLLERQFDFANGRRNLRQSFTIGLIVALAIGAPIQTLYQQALSRSPEETAALAEKLVALEERRAALQADTTVQAEQRFRLMTDSLLLPLGKILRQSHADSTAGPTGLPKTLIANSLTSPDSSAGEYFQSLGQKLRSIAYWLGCVITAILVSFGAPFWNDIVKSILYFQQSRRRQIRPAMGAPGKDATDVQ